MHLHLLPRYFERYFERYFQRASTSEAQVSSASHSSALHPPSNSHNLHYGYSVYTDRDGFDEYMISEFFYPPSNSNNLRYGCSATDGYFPKSHSHKLVKLFFFLDIKTLHPKVSMASKPIISQGAFGLGSSARFSLSVSHLLLRQVSCHVMYVMSGILSCKVCDVGYPVI